MDGVSASASTGAASVSAAEGNGDLCFFERFSPSGGTLPFSATKASPVFGCSGDSTAEAPLAGYTRKKLIFELVEQQAFEIGKKVEKSFVMPLDS